MAHSWRSGKTRNLKTALYSSMWAYSICITQLVSIFSEDLLGAVWLFTGLRSWLNSDGFLFDFLFCLLLFFCCFVLFLFFWYGLMQLTWPQTCYVVRISLIFQISCLHYLRAGIIVWGTIPGFTLIFRQDWLHS